MLTTPPRWFTEALSVSCEHRTTRVAGCPVHSIAWGAAGRPGLLFVHGGAAHAGWFSFLAPFFADGYRVVAVDLSGHGDSGHRDHYDRSVFVDEVMSVAADWGLLSPVIIGHSMGGIVSLRAGAAHGSRFSGVVAIDAPIRRPGPAPREEHAPPGRLSPRCYETEQQILARFRLVPDQPCDNRFIVDHIARTSIRRTDAGYSWKFDAKVFADGFERESVDDVLAGVGCRVALIRGALSSIVDEETWGYAYGRLGRVAPLIEIPEAHHHVLLDQPLALVSALRALLQDWAHSTPKARPSDG